MTRPVPIAKALFNVLLGLIATSTWFHSPAQQAKPAGVQDQTPVFTLKVYTNRVQVPTLVLDHDRDPMKPIDFGQFLVSLDGGKRFAPTRVRMEGDDPLDLSILIDVSGREQEDLVSGLDDAIIGMAATALRPQDRVSIYELSCNLLRVADEVPPSTLWAQRTVDEGLKSPKLGKTSSGVPCGKHVYLWGAITAVVTDRNEAKGRRALLVVSDGRDDGSVVSLGKLHDYAGGEGVALFGLRNISDVRSVWQRDHTDPFASLCESTGGIVMEGGRRDLQKRLQQWIKLLRGRYVVEFPRPQSLDEGAHIITISLKKDAMAFTTVAGVSVSLPDPKITSDPNYMPSNEGSDIPVGNRRRMPQ